jgi:hypothetical protein
MTQLTLDESMTHKKRGGTPEGSTNNPDGGPEGPYNKRCPYCGDRFGKLPSHLPECDEAQASSEVTIDE